MRRTEIRQWLMDNGKVGEKFSIEWVGNENAWEIYIEAARREINGKRKDE